MDRIRRVEEKIKPGLRRRVQRPVSQPEPRAVFSYVFLDRSHPVLFMADSPPSCGESATNDLFLNSQIRLDLRRYSRLCPLFV